MNVPLFIARRYFFSRKKRNFINVISIISMIVVGLGTMSLVIVLSVFNGLEGLLRSLYGTFDPQIVITSHEGKSFEINDSLLDELSQIPGVTYVTEVIEDNVLIKYKNAQRVVRMKGVSDPFLQQQKLDAALVYGQPIFKKGELDYAIVGRGVQYDLSINPQNDFFTLQVYYPKNIRPGQTDPTSMYRVQHALPAGTFAIEKYYDENYMFVSLEFAKSLLEYGNRRTSIEISHAETQTGRQIQKAIQQKLGDQFVVRLGEELHEDLYKILKIEKLFVFIIFSLIIGIASINIFFAMTMLVIEKRRDISILFAMGAAASQIKRVFLQVGFLISFVGAGVGLVLGITLSLLQEQYGFVSMGMQTTVMDAYPVSVELMDIFITVICIIGITFLATIHPAIRAARQFSVRDL